MALLNCVSSRSSHPKALPNKEELKIKKIQRLRALKRSRDPLSYGTPQIAQKTKESCCFLTACVGLDVPISLGYDLK